VGTGGVTGFLLKLLQVVANAKTPSEDCLFLNVWTKPQSGEKKKAVMVWIYGGGFVIGDTSMYDGSKLAASQDVVVVSVAYRLSIFGFPGAPGLGTQNLGFLDQRAGLEWVRDNIAQFGGDPNRIILFGESVGAMSVDWYSYMWKEDPIVQGFITQSGQAQASDHLEVVLPPATERNARWDEVARNLGCAKSSFNDSGVACMRTKSVQQIQEALPPTPQIKLVFGHFGPYIDGKYIFPNYDELTESGAFTQKVTITLAIDLQNLLKPAQSQYYSVPITMNLRCLDSSYKG